LLVTLHLEKTGSGLVILCEL